MSSPASTLPATATYSPTTAARRPPLGLIVNAKKHKHSFIQLFTMSGILLLSLRSLGQKFRIHDLIDDTSFLKQEHDVLSLRMESIKQGDSVTTSRHSLPAFSLPGWMHSSTRNEQPRSGRYISCGLSIQLFVEPEELTWKMDGFLVHCCS